MASRAAELATRVRAVSLLPTSLEPEAESVLEAVQAAGLDGVPVIHMGTPRANRKPVALVMRDTTALAVVKVGVDPLTDQLLDRERCALEAFAAQPPTGVTVPRLLTHGEVGNHVFTAQTVLPGSTEGGSRRLTDAEAVEIALSLSGPGQPVELSTSTWAQRLAVAVAGLPLGPDRDMVCAAWERWLRSASAQVNVGRSHGDFSPWNTRRSRMGVEAWDWERFTSDSPVGFDIVHWQVQRRLSDHRSVKEAVIDATRAAVVVLREQGIPVEEARLIVGSYAIALAARTVADGQRSFGRPIALVDEWLQPTLESSLDNTEGAL